MRRSFVIPFSWLVATVCAAVVHRAFGWPFGVFNVLMIGVGSCVGYIFAAREKGGTA